MTEQESLGNEPAPEPKRNPGPSTQEAHPVKASLRTFVQAFVPAVISLVLVAPEILDALLDVPLPGEVRAWLLGISGAVAGIAAALARLMAIPAVNDWLITLGLGTGTELEASYASSKKAKRDRLVSDQEG